jgi:hypothetical protein
VGVAAEYRKEARILEQGALFSAFIAKCPNGRTACLLENCISKHGITQMVNSSYKIKNLPVLLTNDEVKEMIESVYTDVTPQLPKHLQEHIIKPEYNFFNEINDINKDLFVREKEQMSLFDEPTTFITEYQTDVDPTAIVGNIINVIGGILVVDNGGEITAYNTSKMSGSVVKITN